MAWTAPVDAVAGTLATAANFNTYLFHNVAWLGTDAPTCRVYNSSDFSHNSSGNVLNVTFNAERFDNATMHSTVSNTSRITIPSGGDGKYLFGASIAWAASATGNRYLWLALTSPGPTTAVFAVQDHAPPAGAFTMGIHGYYSAAATAYTELGAFQNSGGTLAITAAAAYSPELWAFWVRT